MCQLSQEQLTLIEMALRGALCLECVNVICGYTKPGSGRCPVHKSIEAALAVIDELRKAEADNQTPQSLFD